MQYSIGDRIRVTSETLAEEGILGSTGAIIRTDGMIWPYGVVMDREEDNTEFGFNWLDPEEFEPDPGSGPPVDDQREALLHVLGLVMARNDDLARKCAEEQDRADMWEDSYKEVVDDAESKNDSRSETEEKLKNLLTVFVTEAIEQTGDAEHFKEAYNEQFERNEELYEELLREKSKNLQS